MATAAELLASLATDRPVTGDRVSFNAMPEAHGTVTHKAGHGGKFGIKLDGTGQTVYVTTNQIRRIT